MPSETEYIDDPSLPVGQTKAISGGETGYLVENFRIGGKPHWSAIDVHIDAMRLLQAGGDAPAILAGLKAVRERYMDKDAL